ncbi:MAG TPA: MBL fold metallo-hydrolase [Bryobacteraceae bacterium]|nr:MBL fold metallo-hydrolase [Bryobacteraceae bacterium]
MKNFRSSCNRLAAIALVPAFALAAFAARTTDQFKTSAGPLRITPIQHAALMIQAGSQVILVDPAQGDFNGLPPADLVLITDIHGDHFVPAMINKVKKSSATVIGPQAVASQFPGTTVMRNGETKKIGAWTIEAVPMYNMKRKQPNGQFYHPKGRGNGYVLGYGGLRIYIAGDTEGTPEMRALKNIDVAFIPMNLPYTMPPAEAAEAVKAFHPKVVYPYHYRGSDLKTFQTALQGTGIDVRLRGWYPQ